ncbi:hypothetical protein BO71DRAFT_435185 [Aspergillus ellipticus CBS 707.79]|uniref:Uncharacterized protein n=1 Tax=Aspergillus ellipticus CBS 707.79 TaxID=1448320 RepID=A0A319CW13_9EURO|nr:hypothetical protein BO71DRAFT_435185 [Aspergillus ellipticus CBS 707.79]
MVLFIEQTCQVANDIAVKADALFHAKIVIGDTDPSSTEDDAVFQWWLLDEDQLSSSQIDCGLGLKAIANQYLKMNIQGRPGKSCPEDTFACREVLLWCMRNQSVRSILTDSRMKHDCLFSEIDCGLGLKAIAKHHLGMKIQGHHGHSCPEDTFACREVLVWCLRNQSMQGILKDYEAPA